MRNPLCFTLCLPVAGLLAVVPMSRASQAANSGAGSAKASAPAAGESESDDRFNLGDLLPTAWQKRPKLRFNVFTEMTAEGRKRREPTPERPLTYFAPPGTFGQAGWQPSAGEKPPSWPQLQETMQKALAANGYVPIANDQQRPDVLIVFTYGSHGTDIGVLADTAETPPTSAEELVNWVLADPSATQDVIQRARFIGGDRVALELVSALRSEAENRRINASAARGGGPAAAPVNPDFGSPFQLLLRGGKSKAMRNVVELAFHTCYFVTATAYDFSGVEKKQKIPLWQTRMTIEAQGVDLQEVLRPLIINTGPSLGRETPEAVIVDKRINREGRVEIGESKVVEEKDPKPAAPDPAARR